MKPLEIRKYLFDIAQACELLAQFIAGKALADYAAEPLLRSAVERQFEIIAFRNRLIHAYASIADEVVWGVLETNLPTLRRELDALLKEDSD